MKDPAFAAGIIGDSPAIRHVRALIERVAQSRLPVLIQGPTGSGKELVARAVHAASGRPGRCVAFNVCAVSETMFEDALFGHVRGAFTGATSDSRGYLAEADRGTVFLDEISGLALPAQAKLLRAIETGEFRPVGAREDRKSDFRVIAATNVALDALIAAGSFRSDLAHRLGGIVIEVPPLQERTEDIPPLVEHFLRSALGTGRTAQVTPGALRVLQERDWPGNVRELRHAVERAIALTDRSVLGREEINLALQHGGQRLAPASGYERRRLLEVLEASGWDTARVASILGVHRATVYRRMHRLGVTPPEPPHAVGADLSVVRHSHA